MEPSEGTIRCEEALRLLAAYLDGELPRQQHGDLERHLEACRSCYSRADFERRLKVRLAGLGRREPDPEFGTRLRGLLGRFAQGTAPQAPAD